MLTNIGFSRRLRWSIFTGGCKQRAKYVACTEVLESWFRSPEKRWEQHQIFNSAHLKKHACYRNVHLHFLPSPSPNNYCAHTVLDTQPHSKHLACIMFASPRLNTDTATKNIRKANSRLPVRSAREEERAAGRGGRCARPE